MTGMDWWLNKHLETWLGEKNVADTLTHPSPTTSPPRWGWSS